MDSYLEALQSFHQDLAGAVVHYLKASTKEIEVRTALMRAEFQEIVAKQEQEREKQEERERGQGMMRTPYGYCPKCGEPGISRSRRDGADRCREGHTYPSDTAVLRFDKVEDDHVNDNQS